MGKLPSLIMLPVKDLLLYGKVLLCMLLFLGVSDVCLLSVNNLIMELILV